MRATVRLLAAGLWTFWIYISLNLRVVYYRLLPGDRSRKEAEARTWTFGNWSRVLCWILGVRIERTGTPPEPPFFLVSNHLSYLDIVVLGGAAPSVFLSKAEVANWPVVGTLCRLGDTLFIKRERKRDIPKVVEQIIGVLRGGRGVVIFPEGTTSGGVDVAPFRASLLDPAAKSEIPVSFVSLSYGTAEGSPPARESVCWWGDMPFGPHVWALLKLKRIDAKIDFGDRTVTESDRKALAEQLHAAVSAQFRPVDGCNMQSKKLSWGVTVKGKA